MGMNMDKVINVTIDDTYTATIGSYGVIKIYRHEEECIGYEVDNILMAAIYAIESLLEESK